MTGRSSDEAASDDAAAALLASLDRLDLDRVVVAGEYVRFDESARTALKDFRAKVVGGLSAAGRRPTNLLLWGAPGSGKSFLVQQIARTVGGAARLVEVNLAKLDSDGFRSALAGAASGPTDVVCLVDEVDAHPDAPWPYELLLPSLEPSAPPEHRTVYCLAGSGGEDLEAFRQRLAARPKGVDLLSRIPRGNSFTVPSLGVGDKLVVVATQLLEAASTEGRPIREIEKFALYYVAATPELQSARQLRALATEAVRRIPPGEDRFRFDHLFAAGDAENKRFWYEHAGGRERLAGVFVPMVPPTAPGPAPSSRPPTPEPRPPVAPLPPDRLAILPFLNISPDPSDAYFADGLTEELIATVSRIQGLHVIARTSVMRFRDGAKSAAETARELRVGALLEGSVRRAGVDLRVTAQLIDVATEEPLWSTTFDRRLENVFAIQAELAQRIAESLHVRLRGGERATLGRTPTRSLEAYDLYLQGRQRFFEASREGFVDAIDRFERAVALDAAFALAHCGLAEAYALQGNRGHVPLGPALERAERSARTALRLDPDLGEAHAALAPILFNRYEWRAARGELDRALALEPNNVQALFWRAVTTGALGCPEDGLDNALRAVELDPLNPRRRVILAQQYYWLRRYDDAITVLASPIVGDRPDVASIRAYSLLLSGRREAAVATARQTLATSPDVDIQQRMDAAAVLARADLPDAARAMLTAFGTWAGPDPIAAGAYAWLHVALGEFDLAVADYLRAYDERTVVGVPDLLVDPFLDSFRRSPRFPELVRRFGLPDDPGSSRTASG